MSDAIVLKFLALWLVCQLLAWLMLRWGSHCINHPLMRRLGHLAHQQKMRALVKIWPLNRLIPALNQHHIRRCQVIITGLIMVKSLLCLVLGVVMIIWLPLAAFVVPAIITEHDPADQHLQTVVHRIAFWQVTSHALAAAMGAVLLLGWWQQNPQIINLDPTVVMTFSWALVGVVFCAWLAGKHETALLQELYANKVLAAFKATD
ncbi:hypothetical protein [Marinicella meishanensis]|uniref:hypothetical protein n=1 Tax=Marinicella meishanensis TaxID=2873263 RepID=UPI001CBE1243|nr:hypothetical protein [Marinicella sp. NBU2979]